ncbi:LOW QUALITY PROTEIN: UBN2 domain-containing protein, partial [Cephalotus follicularis]
MSIFIQSLDYTLWNIITNDPEIPTKIVNGKKVSKLDNEYNNHDYKLLQLNAKAKHVIFCALSPSEFNRVSSLDVKEMWDRLMVTYEGTNQVKDTKRLVHDYELFTMLENENISSMYARFNDIINALKGLGKVYINHELVKDLLGSLMTHELRMSDQARNDSKKKMIALKASKEEESDDEE